MRVNEFLGQLCGTIEVVECCIKLFETKSDEAPVIVELGITAVQFDGAVQIADGFCKSTDLVVGR